MISSRGSPLCSYSLLLFCASLDGVPAFITKRWKAVIDKGLPPHLPDAHILSLSRLLLLSPAEYQPTSLGSQKAEHVIVYNNNKPIKLTYNSKNHDIITSKTQTVGRFHHATTPSHITHKLSGPHATLIKSHDYTSHTPDIILPAITIIHELLLLDYKLNQTTSILTKTRSRPNPIWSTISDLISYNHTKRNTDNDINDA